MTSVAQPTRSDPHGLAARLATTSAPRRARALALGVSPLHVVDDSFLQPEPGTSAGRPPGRRARADGAPRRGGLGLPAAAGRRPRHGRAPPRLLRVSRRASRRSTTPGRRGPPATTSPASSPFRPASSCSGSGAGRSGGPGGVTTAAPGATGAGSCSRSARSWPSSGSSFPWRSRMSSPTRRAPGCRPAARRPVRGRRVHDL